MNTLRAKFALLLVASIVSAVVLITLGVMYAATTPKSLLVDMLAEQLILPGDPENLPLGAVVFVADHPEDRVRAFAVGRQICVPSGDIHVGLGQGHLRVVQKIGEVGPLLRHFA